MVICRDTSWKLKYLDNVQEEIGHTMKEYQDIWSYSPDFFFMCRFTLLEKLVISYLCLFLPSHTHYPFRHSYFSLLLGLSLFNRPPYPSFISSFEPLSFNLNGVSTYRGRCESMYIRYWLICWNSLKINDIYHTSQLSYLWGHVHKDTS